MRQISFYILLLLSAVFSANGEFLEIDSLKEMLPYIDQNSLLLLDIDNTLMEPVQSLGGDQWFRHHKKELLQQGLSHNEALEQSLRDWRAVQHLSKMQAVEDTTAEIVSRLQEEGYPLMGLTTRGLGMSTLTVQQLDSIGIDLHFTSPSHQDVFFVNERGNLYHRGVLFTAGSHKGEALRLFLEQAEYHPKRVVFVNDKHSHIIPVEKTCLELGIPFLGLRYSYLDEKVAHFQPEVAAVQWDQFGHILSDEEAQLQLTEIP